MDKGRIEFENGREFIEKDEHPQRGGLIDPLAKYATKADVAKIRDEFIPKFVTLDELVQDYGRIIDNLREVIRAALDCPSHFHKPDIKAGWRDKDITIDFNKSIVLCDQCVDRLRKALGLKDNEEVPLSHQMLTLTRVDHGRQR